MADLRRRKLDDESGKYADDDSSIATKPSKYTDTANASDDEQQQSRRSTGLTTADSSDHVSIT